MSELTEAGIKAVVLSFLEKKGSWGSHYFPLDALVRWLSKKIKRNGRIVKKSIEGLVKEGFILTHKRGEAVSLNPAMSREIMQYIKAVSEL